MFLQPAFQAKAGENLFLYPIAKILLKLPSISIATLTTYIICVSKYSAECKTCLEHICAQILWPSKYGELIASINYKDENGSEKIHTLLKLACGSLPVYLMLLKERVGHTDTHDQSGHLFSTSMIDFSIMKSMYIKEQNTVMIYHIKHMVGNSGLARSLPKSEPFKNKSVVRHCNPSSINTISPQYWICAWNSDFVREGKHAAFVIIFTNAPLWNHWITKSAGNVHAL